MRTACSGRPQVRDTSSETNDVYTEIQVVRFAACVPDPPLRGAASSVSNIDVLLVVAQWESLLCALCVLCGLVRLRVSSWQRESFDHPVLQCLTDVLRVDDF